MMYLRKLKQKVKELKKTAGKLYLALMDHRTPWPAKILAGLTLTYLLSPVDLIPDFIPVLGLLDDLLIVPALILLSLRLIPAEVLMDVDQQPELRKRWYYALPVVLMYLLLAWQAWGWIQQWTLP